MGEPSLDESMEMFHWVATRDGLVASCQVRLAEHGDKRFRLLLMLDKYANPDPRYTVEQVRTARSRQFLKYRGNFPRERAAPMESSGGRSGMFAVVVQDAAMAAQSSAATVQGVVVVFTKDGVLTLNDAKARVLELLEAGKIVMAPNVPFGG